MFNPLKVLSMPKYTVGLTVDDRFIGAVRAYRALGRLEIDRVAFKEVENPEHLQEELGEFFQREDLVHDMLVSCIPTSRAVVRQIPLVFDNLKKLGRVIKYQMEPFVPHPIDDMVVDFLPPRPGGDIITAGVLKKVLSEHLESLSQAGLEPKVVSLDDLALFLLYLHTHPGDSGQAASIVNLGENKWVVQILSGGKLDFIRILPETGEDYQGLIESFNLYRLKNPDTPLGKILLTGPQGSKNEVAENLESLLKIKTRVWKPFDEIKHRLGHVETSLQTRLSVPLGLAIGTVEGSEETFDLRKEEFVVGNSVNSKNMSALVVTLILLLGLFTFNLHYKLNLQERRYAELKARTRQLFKRAFPATTQFIKGRELAQMDQKMNKEMGKYQWLDNVTQDGSVLKVIMALTRSVEGVSDVKIENLSMEGKEIRLDGRSPSYETVDKLEKQLTNTGLFQTIKLVGAKIDKKDKTVKFNFSIEKKNEN